MSQGFNTYLQAFDRGLLQHGDKENLRLLKLASSEWRQEKNYFGAAFASGFAVKAAWGDPLEMYSCATSAIQDYRQCIETRSPESLEYLAALWRWSQELRHLEYSQTHNRSFIVRARMSLWEELAQNLVTHYADSEHAVNYLAKGFKLKTDLCGVWEAEFPEYEIDYGVENFGRGQALMNLPSAFHLFILLSDYGGAQAVIDRCAHWFATPGLRGWKAAIHGFLVPTDAPESFLEAADSFAQDVQPSHDEMIENQRSWSSINIDLWAKYFRARSMLATAVREPARIQELLNTAVETLRGTESGWHSPKVSRFRILIQTLAQLSGADPYLSLDMVREEFLLETRITPEEPDDPLIQRFLTLASDAFEGFRQNPAHELTSGRLPAALDALARIPLIGQDITAAVRPAVGDRAFQETLGPIRSWIYRTLENITKEVQLQHIILRLAQASLPMYAQILHGPVEYGKDIVVLLNQKGHPVLQMYQVKSGNITKTVWDKARNELEEMFLVPPSALLIPNSIQNREGILICNGQATPYVVPVIEAWFQEQRTTFGRNYRFMHLDDLVQWITRDRLYNELRAALSDLGLQPMRS